MPYRCIRCSWEFYKCVMNTLYVPLLPMNAPGDLGEWAHLESAAALPPAMPLPYLINSQAWAAKIFLLITMVFFTCWSELLSFDKERKEGNVCSSPVPKSSLRAGQILPTSGSAALSTVHWRGWRGHRGTGSCDPGQQVACKHTLCFQQLQLCSHKETQRNPRAVL